MGVHTRAPKSSTTWLGPATPPSGLALPGTADTAGASDAAPARGRATADPTGWSDSSARTVLQLMAESVAEMVGFEVAALSVVLDDQLVTMAFTGPEEVRDYLFEPDPVTILDPVIRDAETWGRFLFLAEEDQHEELAGHWAVTSVRQDDAPDAWRPLDVLLALLRDDAGRLIGMLSVDRPTSGRRPDALHRDLLERYAAQTERAVITAYEREALVQQVTHAETARRLIRAASMPAHASLEAVLRSTHRPLVEGFGATGSWIQVFDPHGGGGQGYARTLDGGVVQLSDRLVGLCRAVAPRLWADQRVLIIDDRPEHQPTGSPASAQLFAEATRELSGLGLASAIAVPLGAGSECLGFLVLTRRAEDPAWSTIEAASALEIGHDLGAALITARALERERTLVRELQQLDDHRSQLIATLSHELRTPLSVISGNLEMLGDLDLDDAAAHYHRAMGRGTDRMQRVVDDLLLLARVSDPRQPLDLAPVDLHAVIGDVVALVASSATAKQLDLTTDLEPTRLVVPGDTAELDRLVSNLVSNAVKYTPAGGSVTVSTRADGDRVLLRVSDTGLGISEEDQVGLFRAFFRTTNPDALRETGTGLGLSIVDNIAGRHGGSVEVTSRLHEGTTFTVDLPRNA